MEKFSLGGSRPPITLKDWAEMIAHRLNDSGVAIKEEEKEEAIDVLHKILGEFYRRSVKDITESILKGTPDPYVKDVMEQVRERELNARAKQEKAERGDL